MAQLVVVELSGSRVNEGAFALRKRWISVGTEPAHDIVVSAGSPGLLFSLSQRADGRYELVPARVRVWVNGQAATRTTPLASCDRLEWAGGAAAFVESEFSPVAAREAGASLRSLEVLQNVAATLQGAGAVPAALHQALDAFVEMAGAEAGFLLSELGGDSGWECVASKHDEGERTTGRRELLSNSILQEALRRSGPVFIENIIGHPLADAASVIEARIFSAACIPLKVGGRVFGAVFLATRSPGRSIRKESIPELSLLAAQAALLLASSAELGCERGENARLRSLLGAEPGAIVCSGGPMAEVARRVAKLAPTPLSVLVLGETGVGKEVVAREFHRLSDRARGPFVAVNCAAIPAMLLESTLFGHERGAFTGASRPQPGKFAQANGGTLFLDEIGDLPLELQAKLLRVLQDGQVEPLGASRPLSVDVRVIAATHQEIEADASRFRQDLYFRLSGATIRIPALRERRGDIRPLAQHFLARSGSRARLSAEALAALEAHSWPGNVRELEQAVTRAALLTDGPEIRPEHLELRAGVASGAPGTRWLGSLDTAQIEFTREYVRQALAKSGGRRAEAAELLGVSERTLYRLLAPQPDRDVRPS